MGRAFNADEQLTVTKLLRASNAAQLSRVRVRQRWFWQHYRNRGVRAPIAITQSAGKQCVRISPPSVSMARSSGPVDE